MRLLIFTQAMDTTDPVLGFFHRWVTELARYTENISVVCLKEGTHALPGNVRVYSLGKESGESWIKYVFRFYRYLYRLRGTYDRVFVHMNPHYILLGGLFWRIMNVPVFFWRNHAKMNLMTQIAARFSKRVFYTSPYACTSRYTHAMQMPVGIDQSIFTIRGDTKRTHPPIKVLFLGRLSPVKRAEIFVDAGTHMPPGYELHLYGDDSKPNQQYLRTLRGRAGPNVFFHAAVPNDKTPEVYRAHDIYVNLTPEGSMDKAVLEAVSCGVPVLVANKSFVDVVPSFSMLTTISPEALATSLVSLAELSSAEKEQALRESRERVARDHSLEKLALSLYKYMT